MPNGNEELLRLLEEIRDLLIPVSDAYRDEYDERNRIRALLEEVVNTRQRRKMYSLMNGRRSQTDIAQEIGVNPSTVSRFVSALVEAELADVVKEGVIERPVRKYDLKMGTERR